MSRKPIYNTDKTERVVSCANDTWTYQKFTGPKDAPKSNKSDPWMNCFSPVADKTRAMTMLNASNKAIEEEQTKKRAA